MVEAEVGGCECKGIATERERERGLCIYGIILFVDCSGGYKSLNI